jgi:hypothetical protein
MEAISLLKCIHMKYTHISVVFQDLKSDISVTNFPGGGADKFMQIDLPK